MDYEGNQDTSFTADPFKSRRPRNPAISIVAPAWRDIAAPSEAASRACAASKKCVLRAFTSVAIGFQLGTRRCPMKPKL